MASEDSDELLPGLSVVHRLSNLRDLDEPFWTEMLPSVCQFDTESELLEVQLFRGSERMRPEERDDRLQQLRSSFHDELAQVFPMVVVSSVNEDPTHAEELAKLLDGAETPHPCVTTNR